jgi:hypothetical protein
MGCPPNFRLAVMTVAAACRWPLCLGTLVWVEELMLLARSEKAPWPATQLRLVTLLSSLPRLADRITLVEQLGRFVCSLAVTKSEPICLHDVL